jgi:hypothetical protein
VRRSAGNEVEIDEPNIGEGREVDRVQARPDPFVERVVNEDHRPAGGSGSEEIFDVAANTRGAVITVDEREVDVRA